MKGKTKGGNNVGKTSACTYFRANQVLLILSFLSAMIYYYFQAQFNNTSLSLVCSMRSETTTPYPVSVNVPMILLKFSVFSLIYTLQQILVWHNGHLLYSEYNLEYKEAAVSRENFVSFFRCLKL